MESTAIFRSSTAPTSTSNPSNNKKKQQQESSETPIEVRYVPRLYSLCLVGNAQRILHSNHAFVKEITAQLDSEATAISCGNDWLMILTESGKAYSFGSNLYGQLALGHEESVTSVTPIAFPFSQAHKIIKISCGSAHGGFILDTGALYMFGCGSYGRLGTGNTENCSTPTHIVMHWSSLIAKPVKKVVTLANAAANIISKSLGGKQLHQIVTQAKDVDDNVVVFSDISCGERHTIVLATRSSSSTTSANSSTTRTPIAKTSIISFGDGMNGRLGLGSEQDQRVGACITQYKTVNASSTPHIVSISAGTSHNAALTYCGEVFTWGNGADGQLGHGSSDSEWVPREVEFFKSTGISKIRCGAKHTVAVARSGVVYTWGRGDEGQLGHGNFESIPQPQRLAFGGTSGAVNTISAAVEPMIIEAPDARIIVRNIATKQDFCMAQDDNHRIFVWGDNSEHQLGFSKTIGTHFVKPKQLSYMDLRPRKGSGRVDLMSNGLKRIGLAHFDASDQFSVFLFEMKTSALARGTNGNFGILRSTSLLNSMGMGRFRNRKDQQPVDTDQYQDMTWNFCLLDELKTEEIPSKENFYYDMMKNYRVAIKSSNNHTSKTASMTQDDQHHKSHLPGLPLDLVDNLYGDEDSALQTGDDKEDGGEYIPRSRRGQEPSNSIEEERDETLTNENNGHRFVNTKSIKGLDQWLERRNLSASKSNTNNYQFGNAKRSFQTATVRESCDENITSKQQEQNEKPQRPITSRTTDSSKQRSAFGRTIRTASSQTRQKEAHSPKDSNVTNTPPIKTLSTFSIPIPNSAPFGSSVKSRFSWNDDQEKDNENRQPASLLNVDKGFEMTLPRSPTARLAYGDEFSAIIANRLMISRGNGPGPGAYTPTLSSGFVSSKAVKTSNSKKN